MKRIEYPKMVKESVVRGVAFWVILLSLSGVYFGGVWIPLLLVADFLIRGFIHPKFSPLAQLSNLASSRLFTAKDKQIFSTPKRFAARIGLLLSGIAVGFSLGALPNYAAATLLLLGTFSFLECFLRYCAGCKIFGLLARYDLVDTSSCPNCKY